MSAARRRVVITGAAGTIGSAIAPLLPDSWSPMLTDVRSGQGIDALDVTDAGSCAEAFTGADAVVHLAGDPHPHASWADLRGPNVEAVHTVAVAAADRGVRRLVVSSSLQAMSALPDVDQVRSGDAPRPANLYGATKAWAEAIGSWTAASTATSVVAVRIGHFALHPPAGADGTPRNRAAWLSPRDAAELVRAAVEGPVDGFTVVCGVSANRYRKARYGDAERALGYRPVDDAFAGDV